MMKRSKIANENMSFEHSGLIGFFLFANSLLYFSSRIFFFSRRSLILKGFKLLKSSIMYNKYNLNLKLGNINLDLTSLVFYLLVLKTADICKLYLLQIQSLSYNNLQFYKSNNTKYTLYLEFSNQEISSDFLFL